MLMFRRVVAFSQPCMCFASNGTFQKVKSYPFSGRMVIRRNRLSRSLCTQVQKIA